MGTTIAMAVIDENQAYLCHVGDSRIYINNQEEIKQVTKDHTFVNELVDRGAISLEEAKHHSQKNVLLRLLVLIWKLNQQFLLLILVTMI